MKKIAIPISLGAVFLCGLYAARIKPDNETPSTKTTATIDTASDSSKLRVKPRQYIALLDASASRPRPLIFEGQQFLHTLIDQMNYGDSLILLAMYERGVNDTKPSFVTHLTKAEDVTSLEEQEHLEAQRKGLKDAADLFFKNSLEKPILHTDIITTLSIASEKISPDTHNCLILLSDMLQSSSDFEFEHLRRMPTSAWIADSKKQGLIRPLYGSSIVVIGADPSTRDGVVVREFWERYFIESNASLKLQNYRTTPPSEASACE